MKSEKQFFFLQTSLQLFSAGIPEFQLLDENLDEFGIKFSENHFVQEEIQSRFNRSQHLENFNAQFPQYKDFHETHLGEHSLSELRDLEGLEAMSVPTLTTLQNHEWNLIEMFQNGMNVYVVVHKSYNTVSHIYTAGEQKSLIRGVFDRHPVDKFDQTKHIKNFVTNFPTYRFYRTEFGEHSFSELRDLEGLKRKSVSGFRTLENHEWHLIEMFQDGMNVYVVVDKTSTTVKHVDGKFNKVCEAFNHHFRTNNEDTRAVCPARKRPSSEVAKGSSKKYPKEKGDDLQEKISFCLESLSQEFGLKVIVQEFHNQPDYKNMTWAEESVPTKRLQNERYCLIETLADIVYIVVEKTSRTMKVVQEGKEFTTIQNLFKQSSTTIWISDSDSDEN